VIVPRFIVYPFGSTNWHQSSAGTIHAPSARFAALARHVGDRWVL